MPQHKCLRHVAKRLMRLDFDPMSRDVVPAPRGDVHLVGTKLSIAEQPERGAGVDAAHVFCTTMLGNFVEKSSAFFVTAIATLRAIALYARAIVPSGSAITVGRPESACSRM